jgi:hypothetical protein
MICPYCNKEILFRKKTKDYTAIIEKLRAYDGQSLKTADIQELLKEFYSPTTEIRDTALVKSGIIKKVSFALFLINIPKSEVIK